jgi:hypothetical protein
VYNLTSNILFFLFTSGITIHENHRIDIKILAITGDSPALRNILNFTGHGGYYCCNFCYIRGVHVDKKRQYFYEKRPVLRDSSTYNEESVGAEKQKRKIYGHKGKFRWPLFSTIIH